MIFSYCFREETVSDSVKESRFVVSRKRWGRRSPKLKGNKKNDTGGHPLLSKIQRITSPSASGENTPLIGLSPSKKPSNVSLKPSDYIFNCLIIVF